MSGMISTGPNPMSFTRDDSTGSANSGDGMILEPSPEKPVTSARTPTERKRKPRKNAQQQSAGTPANPNLMSGTPIGDLTAPGSKPISEYFPKRAPASPARGGTKSPLSFGSAMYPQSPKATFSPASGNPVASTAGNANNGPPMGYERMGSYPGDNFNSAGRPSKPCQTDLTMSELNQQSADLNSRDNRIDELTRTNDELSRHLSMKTKEVDEKKSTISKCLNVVKELLIEKSTIERKEARAKCMQNRLRLGQFVTQRVGATFQENWTDGYAFQELSKRQEEIANEREEIDKKKKLLAKRKPSEGAGPSRKRSNTNANPNSANPNQSAGSGVGTGSDSPGSVAMLNRDGNSQGSNAGQGALHNGSLEETMFTKPPPRDGMTMQEYYEAEEILKLRYASLRKEDSDLQLEMEKLERSRNLHIRELKRIHNEDQSR